MALESVTAAETLIQSNADNDDLEDGEIPSDEDDEPVPPPPPKPTPEPSKSSSKSDSHKEKSSDSKSSKSKSKSSSSSTSGSKSDRFTKYKNPSEDWAGDVEKAIKAVLDEDKKRDEKNKSSKSSSSSSRSKSRKRSRDDKEADERAKEQKKRRFSEEENGNEDDDELLFIRGASPVRKESHDMSPMSRRSHERENFDNNRDSDRDSEERSSRHRDEKRSNNRSSTPRRSGKNERGGKNKSRANARSERNGRRNQSNDHNQDPDSICVYFMQGKCHRGDDCPFSHNAMPPRKMELCKFYLMDCCAKRDKCLYMHHDFPCKFFHTGLKCTAGTNCKFSHEPLNEQVKNILLKHLETAPKEILGDFPRLSRESALMMINNTSRNSSQGRDGNSQKIPSLFDVALPTMGVQGGNALNDKEEEASATGECQKRASSGKEKKSAGKKTRWGSDDDRVPLEQIMLLQSVSQFGLNLPNVALSLAVQQQLQQRLLLQQCIANMEFYNEIQGNTSADNKTKETEGKANDGSLRVKPDNSGKDIDLRQLLTNVAPKTSQSSTDELANSSMTKFDEESDREEESNLVIEVPVDDEEKNRDADKRKNEEKKIDSDSSNKLEGEDNYQESRTNLPKQAQELFMRIQQQQRAADENSIGNSNSNNNNVEDDEKNAVVSALKDQEEWYSDESDNGNNDDNDDDDDDDEGGNLQIVIKDNQRDESEKSDQESPVKKQENVEELEPSILIPQPAPIIDKLGDLSKIDISAEVTKLLSSIKPQSSKKNISESSRDSDKTRASRTSPDQEKSCIKESDASSPKSSPSTSSAPVSRDPRMSRDPRQRRMEDNKPSSPSISDSKKESRTLRLETSIYSSGITSMDAGMDTDLRARLDQDHRRKDMDLRQTYQDFGDTDLRMVGGSFEGSNSSRSDVDLRQMLTLPFKPAPSHVPCTEIDASIASHPQTLYKVYVVDIPRPNYTGLKLTKNDAAVKHDPRLRKIFRLSKSDMADSPMSPPPLVKQLDTPKSPPLHIRADPRRKTLEASALAPTSVSASINPIKSSGNELQMNLGPSLIPPGGLNMGMNQNPMLGGVGSLPNIMNPQMQQHQAVPMAMSGMAPNGSSHQLGFDPRFVPRNGGPGLLGPAPGLGYPDVGPNYDAPYAGNNYNNFGPGPNDPIMPFGPSNSMNYCNNPPEWTGSTNSAPNPVIRNRGRVRRRNRNRSNANANRGNRSSPQ